MHHDEYIWVWFRDMSAHLLVIVDNASICLWWVICKSRHSRCSIKKVVLKDFVILKKNTNSGIHLLAEILLFGSLQAFRSVYMRHKIRNFVWIGSHLPKESLIENFIFCAVIMPSRILVCWQKMILKKWKVV